MSKRERKGVKYLKPKERSIELRIEETRRRRHQDRVEGRELRRRTYLEMGTPLGSKSENGIKIEGPELRTETGRKGVRNESESEEGSGSLKQRQIKEEGGTLVLEEQERDAGMRSNKKGGD
ncbi:hypothetical protein DFH28DRAFT_923619 [Melampsora americana]|nr:hypothetical protein DFH28DRAFT_923619 [Melampsora americana]